MLLAEFFYGCNIPFAVADSIYFKKFIKALRPAYSPPHRRFLSGKLLDKVHDKIEKRNLEAIKKMDKEATLLIDGWQNSSSNRHNVVTMLATSNDQKVFLESFDFSSVRETGENLFKALEKSVTVAKERYDATISSVLSDNASNMVSMGNASVELMDLLYSTCNAHTGNLLAGDIIQQTENKKIMKKVKRVQKDFRRTALSDRLLKYGGHKPVLFSTTRWASQRDAADSLLKNLPSMKKVVAECENEAEIDPDAIQPKAKITQLLFNVNFLASV